MIQTDAITTLAALATASADYESAWRDYAMDASARPAAVERMNDAERRRQQATERIASEVSREAAEILRGAFIMASARVSGQRPPEHVNQRTESEVRDFILLALGGAA